MRLFEVHSFVSIDQEHDHGSLEGYVVDATLPQLQNYLSAQGAEQSVINDLLKKYKRIGLLRNLYVDEDHRNTGIGTSLVDSAINDAFKYGADAVVLVADSNEDNSQLGRSLEDWYKTWGFTTIDHAGRDPIMVLEK